MCCSESISASCAVLACSRGGREQSLAGGVLEAVRSSVAELQISWHAAFLYNVPVLLPVGVRLVLLWGQMSPVGRGSASGQGPFC